MTQISRVLYTSSNGDCWFLVSEDREPDLVFVVHESNAAAGGHRTEVDIATFLNQSGSPPEKQALLRLISGLAEGTAPETSRAK
jgi:hypothetical protein